MAKAGESGYFSVVSQSDELWLSYFCWKKILAQKQAISRREAVDEEIFTGENARSRSMRGGAAVGTVAHTQQQHILPGPTTKNPHRIVQSCRADVGGLVGVGPAREQRVDELRVP